MQNINVREQFSNIVQNEIKNMDISEPAKKQFSVEYKARIVELASAYCYNQKIAQKVASSIVHTANGYGQSSKTRAMLNIFSSRSIIDLVLEFREDEQIALGIISGLAQSVNNSMPSSVRNLNSTNKINAVPNSIANPILAITSFINSKELIDSINAYKETPEAISLIVMFGSDVAQYGNQQSVDEYARRVRHRSVLKAVSEFYDQSAKENIAKMFAYALRHLKDEIIIEETCLTVQKLAASPKIVNKMLEAIYYIYGISSNEEEVRNKAARYLLAVCENNCTTPKNAIKLGIGNLFEEKFVVPAYENMGNESLNREVVEMAFPYIKAINDKTKINSFFQSKENAYRQFEELLCYLGIDEPRLLRHEEKKRLLSVRSIINEDDDTLGNGAYIAKNRREINEFLHLRKIGFPEHGPITINLKGESRKLDTKITVTSRIVDAFPIGGKNNKKISKQDAIGMLVFGLNGSKNKQKQIEFRNMLKKNFGAQKTDKAIAQWLAIKKEMLKELISAYNKFDAENEASIQRILWVFQNGSSKLSEEKAEELNYILEGVEFMLGSDENTLGRSVIAYTVLGKDNVIDIDSGRVGACTFINNPNNSWTIFNYALDPAIIILNYAISNRKLVIPKQTDVRELTVSGVAICTIGSFIASSKGGTILFVDSVEGGINFRNAINNQEHIAIDPLIHIARDVDVDYVGFYTQAPNPTPKIIADSIDAEIENIELDLPLSTKSYLDSIVKYNIEYYEQGQDELKTPKISVPAKLIDLRNLSRD